MKPFYLLAASGLALATTACGSKPPPVRAALECPATQGELTRTSAASDGKACTYVTSGGAEVTLQLVSAPGGAEPLLFVKSCRFYQAAAATTRLRPPFLAS